ncbi:MAG: NCS2 family permease, partial [Acidobacteria bacterium]|nr:NCS2 family permease [Acidobacteriota bacterium]
MLERLFHIEEKGSTVRTELLGGMTTFMTMSYIIFVQPAILSGAGMDRGAVMTATCLSAALATV